MEKDFDNQFMFNDLGVDENYGNVFSFIDFANVNKWFENDNQDWNSKLLSKNEKLSIDLKKLKSFSDFFSKKTKVYYGEDPKNIKSTCFTNVIRIIFGKKDVVTKDLQKIKHYLNSDGYEPKKYICVDVNNKNYIEIRKCNFDVEISVDAIKMMEYYDTFCIFSGDADFVYLNNFLKKKGKKIIIIKGGYITNRLRKSADLVINAQNIKKNIAKIIKQKPD
jgi:uncharacterized LabA/DUF88 family protein